MNTPENLMQAEFVPTLSHCDLAEIEATETGAGDWAVARRSCLAVLTRSAAELRGAWADPAGQPVMLALLETCLAWRDHLKTAQGFAEAAARRLADTGDAVADGAGSEPLGGVQ